MNRQKLTRAEMIIVVAGAVMLVASFLDFDSNKSAWSAPLFPIVTLIPLYGVLMAGHIAVTRFAKVQLPDDVAGFTWEQLQLAVGFMAALMALFWLVAANDRQIGMWILTLGALAAFAGSLMLQSERHTGVLG
jgi:hypothetical protein